MLAQQFSHSVLVSNKVKSEQLNEIWPGSWNAGERICEKRYIKVKRLMLFIYILEKNYNLISKCIEHMLRKELARSLNGIH